MRRKVQRIDLMSASQFLYCHIKRLPLPEPHVAPCWLCGGVGYAESMPVSKWIGGNFTDHYRVGCPGSDHVCDACVFFTGRLSPVPFRPAKINAAGKLTAGNYRNFSHLFDGDTYANASKGEKPIILDWLKSPRRGPWFAAIADSGQIHTIPFARMNQPESRGLILFEKVLVNAPTGKDFDAITRAIEMLTRGVTKAEMMSGEYEPRSWESSEGLIREFEDTYGRRHRASRIFDLVIWLAQRREDEVENQRTSKGKVKDVDRRDSAHAESSVLSDAREEHPASLADLGGQDAGVSDDDHEPGGVVHGDAEGVANPYRKSRQLNLFD